MAIKSLSINKPKTQVEKRISKREETRNKRADKIAREVRYQMVKHGGIADNNRLFDLLSSWMRVAKKDKFIRP
jgi:hypothetical protein